MTKSKLTIKTRYGVTPNSVLNNNELSLKAKGLFGYLQSKPNGWHFSIPRLTTQLKEGRDAITGVLRELEAFKYLVRRRVKNEGKWAGIDYILSASPYDGKSVRRETLQTGDQLDISKQEYSKQDNIKKENTYVSYKEKICKDAKLTERAGRKIKARLKEYSVEELVRAMDSFANNKWWMQHNSNRGISWFFHSEDRIEQFLRLEPDNKTITIL